MGLQIIPAAYIAYNNVPVLLSGVNCSRQRHASNLHILVCRSREEIRHFSSSGQRRKKVYFLNLFRFLSLSLRREVQNSAGVRMCVRESEREVSVYTYASLETSTLEIINRYERTFTQCACVVSSSRNESVRAHTSIRLILSRTDFFSIIIIRRECVGIGLPIAHV